MEYWGKSIDKQGERWDRHGVIWLYGQQSLKALSDDVEEIQKRDQEFTIRAARLRSQQMQKHPDKFKDELPKLEDETALLSFFRTGNWKKFSRDDQAQVIKDASKHFGTLRKISAQMMLVAVRNALPQKPRVDPFTIDPLLSWMKRQGPRRSGTWGKGTEEQDEEAE